MAWFARTSPDAGARVRLICLPYAGGTAAVYRDWAGALGTGVEVLPVQLPGRGWRLRETPSVDLKALAARAADEVLTGAFVNAAATAAWLRARAPARISLVCMGWNASERCAEDEACAEYLAACLRGEAPPFAPIVSRLRADPSGAKFFDPARPWFPEEDFEACMQLSVFPFAVRLTGDAEGRPCLVRANPDPPPGKTPGAL